jgi:hypothetical protein
MSGLDAGALYALNRAHSDAIVRNALGIVYRPYGSSGEWSAIGGGPPRDADRLLAVGPVVQLWPLAEPPAVVADPIAFDRTMRERDSARASLRECVDRALELLGADPGDNEDGGLALVQAAGRAFEARAALDAPGFYRVEPQAGSAGDTLHAENHGAAARLHAEIAGHKVGARIGVFRLGDPRVFVVGVSEDNGPAGGEEGGAK